ncbi:hypothetical protein DITRI_Ditri08aG0148000 [Diplodiscus trichospermus]
MNNSCRKWVFFLRFKVCLIFLALLKVLASGILVLKKTEEREDQRRTIQVSLHHQRVQDTKNQTKLTLKPGGLEDCVIIDVEESEADNDVMVPMFVTHAEALLDETDDMEFEMEDVEDSIIDIDSSDSKDPLALVEYVDDIYAYYRETEIIFALTINVVVGN